MSRPTPEVACPALLLGHGAGALPPDPAALAAALAGHRGQRLTLWLDHTLSATLLADPGARFADAAAAVAWAGRVWSHLDGGSDEPLAATAWTSGTRWRGQARTGVTLLAAGQDPAAWQLLAEEAGVKLQRIAPLWAGLLVLWESRRVGGAVGPARLIIAEGRALTVLDIADGRLVGFELGALPEAVAPALGPWLESAPAGGVWLAGHGLAGAVPVPVRLMDTLGSPDQDSARLLAALQRSLPMRGDGVEPSWVPPEPLSMRVAALFAATAAVVLALAASESWQARAAAQAVRAEARAAESRAARVPRAATSAPALARLAEPWPQRFFIAEGAVPDGGHWLRFEQRQGQQRLLLAGRVSEPAAAFAVAQRLAAHPAVAEAAVLRSEGPQGLAGFEIAVVPRSPP